MYDVIVVGGRCAGAATGRLLAQAGHRVLIVDRTSFPAETTCTHQLSVASAAVLNLWGLLGGLLAAGCAVSDRTAVTRGATTVDVPNPVVAGVNLSLAPRRSLLDSALLDAARDAGAEVREAFSVRDLVWHGGRVAGVVGYGPAGHAECEVSRVVVGADGRRSLVARSVGAEIYGERPAVACCYYAYWRGTGLTKPAWWLHHDVSVGVIPTDSSLTCIVVRLPIDQWAQFKREPEATYRSQVARFPALAERLACASREGRFVGTADMGQAARQAWGPGWALAGDAGRHSDPMGWAGIGDAFGQAELLAGALDDGLSGRVPLDEALDRFHRVRDRSRACPAARGPQHPHSLAFV